VIIYSASIVGGELHPGDDADEAAWFDPEDLPPLAFKATEAALRAAVGER
jgi:hypothetical protein